MRIGYRILLCALAAAPLAVVFVPALAGGRTFVFRDAAHYYYPLFHWTSGEWGEGRVPLWNPQENGGMPILADATSSVLYPGKLIFLLPLPFATRYVLYIAIHAAAAAGGTYLVARRFRASPQGAVLAAICYSAGGPVLLQATNVVFLVGAAWLPAALLAADRMLRRRSWRAAAALGAVLALMVLGGDPQTAYHAGLLAALYGFFLRRRARRLRAARRNAAPSRRWAVLKSRPALLALAATCLALLAAAQIVPSWQWSRQSSRAAFSKPRSIYEVPSFLARPADADEERPGVLGVTEGLLAKPRPGTHAEHTYHFSVPPWQLAELIWPSFSGRMFPENRRWVYASPAQGRIWFPSVYMGLLPVLLAVLSIRIFRGPARRRWLSWMLMLAAAGSLGWYGPVWLFEELRCSLLGGDAADGVAGYHVGGLYWLMATLLPGYAYFRYPAKLLVVAALAVALLAARGWTNLQRGNERPARRGLLAVAGISAVLAVVALAIRPWWMSWMERAPSDDFFGPLDAAGAHLDLLCGFLHASIFAAAGWWVLEWPASRGKWRPAAGLLLLALCAADVAVAHRGSLPTIDARLLQRRSPIERELAARRPGRVFRASAVGWGQEDWPKSNSSRRQIEGAAWDRATLFPRYHLLGKVELAEVETTISSHDRAAFLEAARRGGVDRGDGLAEPHPVALEALGVTHLILPAGADYPDAQRIQPETRLPANTELWRLQYALPRAWVVRDVVALPTVDSRDPAAVREQTRRVLFPGGYARDFSRAAVVETSATGGVPALSAAPFDSAAESCRVVSAETQRVVVETELAAPGLLVLSDAFDADWTATIASGGGAPARPLTIHRTNRVMRGVFVPAGRHRIVFVYRPWGFYVGAAVSGASWLLLLTALALGPFLWSAATRRRFRIAVIKRASAGPGPRA